VIQPAALNALLPLFADTAHSMAMIKHTMLVVQAAVHFLNPGKVPVFAADKPLYAPAKQIQWTLLTSNYPWERSVLVMFGELHMEKAITDGKQLTLSDTMLPNISYM